MRSFKDDSTGSANRFIEKKANFAQEESILIDCLVKELFYTDGITIVLKLNVRNLRARETSHMAKKIFVHKAHKNLVYTSTHFVHRILFDKLGPVILHNYQPRCLKEQLINGKIGTNVQSWKFYSNSLASKNISITTAKFTWIISENNQGTYGIDGMTKKTIYDFWRSPFYRMIPWTPRSRNEFLKRHPGLFGSEMLMAILFFLALLLYFR
ncbi:hypothetical protein RIR_jg32366.t2 [Rhizophagus irregularis DAOM 181602=DAOM 197198]|nr:hypothetical protein RIR_jg32366.t2 [Rhizophagus irregularis DAOM 181602=DAOM 197198]